MPEEIQPEHRCFPGAAITTIAAIQIRTFASAAAEVGEADQTDAAPNSSRATDQPTLSFNTSIQEEAIDDRRRRIANTRWPDRETVADLSQGVRLATYITEAFYETNHCSADRGNDARWFDRRHVLLF